LDTPARTTERGRPSADARRRFSSSALPSFRDLDLTFRRPATCFVGENGSGKSTLIEAIAEACGLPIWGGSRNEAANRDRPDERAALGACCDLHSLGDEPE
jgi:predicted ATPase